ncbi:MAG: aminoacyl-tRNA hydrolase [Chloroflexota bacterium]|nr:MAG: aminoacyl-tRNA hydrolase [Chloroflexota bacterium]
MQNSEWLIVGLGNPGPRYAGNRHNAGFQVVDLLAAKHRIGLSRKVGFSIVGEGEIAGHSVVLAEPQTFMNESGKAVAALLRKYGRGPRELIVIHDDLDLPLGRIRIRENGSAGGQKGVKSIIEHVGTQEFVRVRIGIGRPGDAEPREAGIPTVDYVLRNFLPSERPVIEDVRQKAVEAVEAILAEGTVAAMNWFNR